VLDRERVRLDDVAHEARGRVPENGARALARDAPTRPRRTARREPCLEGTNSETERAREEVHPGLQDGRLVDDGDHRLRRDSIKLDAEERHRRIDDADSSRRIRIAGAVLETEVDEVDRRSDGRSAGPVRVDLRDCAATRLRDWWEV